MRTALSVFVVLLLFSAFVISQQNPVVKDPTAMAIAQQTMTAMGSAALAGYQDSTATATMTYYSDAGTQNVPAVLKSRSTTESRRDLQRDLGTDTYVRNGPVACITLASGRQASASTVDLNSERVDHIPVLSLLGEYASRNMNVQYMGTTLVNGSLADVIALSFNISGLPSDYDSLQLTQHLFSVDRSSGLVTKVESVRNGNGPPGMTSKVEMYFSNYQAISGIAVPFQRSLYLDGRLTEDLALTSITFNTGLLDVDFAPACGGAQ